MTALTRKYLRCDYCDHEARVANVAAPKLPRGWATAYGFYGDWTHACPQADCQRTQRTLAEENGLEVYEPS